MLFDDLVWSPIPLMSPRQSNYSKVNDGKSHYEDGRKYCRRCEVYYYHIGVFCPCCGTTLRVSPIARKTRKKKTKSTLVT